MTPEIKKALDLALEALLINCGGNTEGIGKEAITAIKQARSAPVQELTNIERHEQNVQKFLAAQPAPVQEPSQREFENWLRSKWTAGYACPKLEGRYTDEAAQSFWECWQAAHGITKGQP